MHRPNTKIYDLISKDVETQRTSDFLRGNDYTFVNTFPFPVHIFLNERKVAVIPAYTEEKIKINPDNQAIHVSYLYKTKNGMKLFEILRPEFISPSTRMIRIGDVVYDNKDTSYYNSHADISGIRFHNRTTFPIEIWNKGKMLGRAAPDDGTNFMSGSPGSVYLNNDANGFRIGEKITFKLPHINREWCSIILNDNYVSDVYVGVINQKFTPPMPDTYNYRIDAPPKTGYTFYEPVTGYITRKTDKNTIL